MNEKFIISVKVTNGEHTNDVIFEECPDITKGIAEVKSDANIADKEECIIACLLYTSPSPRDGLLSRMPSSA